MNIYLLLVIQVNFIHQYLSIKYNTNGKNDTENNSTTQIRSDINSQLTSEDMQGNLSDLSSVGNGKIKNHIFFNNETNSLQDDQSFFNQKIKHKFVKDKFFLYEDYGKSLKEYLQMRILQIKLKKQSEAFIKVNFIENINNYLVRDNKDIDKDFQELNSYLQNVSEGEFSFMNLTIERSTNNLKMLGNMVDFLTGIEELCLFEDPEMVHSCVALLMNVLDFMRSNTNLDLMNTYIIEDENCSKDIMNLAANNYKYLSQLIQFSGKSLQDYGLEEDCISRNYSYYVTKFYIDNNFFLYDHDLQIIYKFLGLDSFQFGLCFVKNCSNYVESLFNETLNPPLFEYARKHGIINMRIFPSKKMEEYTFAFICFSYFLLAILSWKLLCSLFGLFVREKLGSRKNTHFSKDSLNSGETDKDLEKEEEEYLRNKNKKFKNNKNNLFNKNNNKNHEVFSDEEEEYSGEVVDALSFGAFKTNYLDYERKLLERQEGKLLKQFSTPSKKRNFKKLCRRFLAKIAIGFKKFMYYAYQFFAFNKDFWHLCEIKNCFYSDEKIEFISYYKSIILFMHTFNHIFYTAIILPHRDYFNLEYFTSIFFAIFKVSTFALDCYIVLEAAVAIYKLMCFLKKCDNQSLLTFLKFWLFSIPKIIVFLSIYFFFLIQFKNMGTLMTSNTLFNRILIEKFRRKECFSTNEFLIFNIFNFCFDFGSDMSFSKCFRVVHVYVNMFVCFSIFMIVFYFSFKMKNKFFDYAVAFLMFTCSATSFLYFDFASQSYNYTFEFIQGETFSYKFVHLFAVKYFIGVLTGLFFFYSYETVLINSVLNRQDYYMPFRFVFDYIIFLNIMTSKNKKKIKQFNLRLSTEKGKKSNENSIEKLHTSPLKTSNNNSQDLIEEINPNEKSINIIRLEDQNNEECNKFNHNNKKNENEKSNSNNSYENSLNQQNNNLGFLKDFDKYNEESCVTRRSMVIIASGFVIIFLSFYYIIKLKFTERTKIDRFSILNFSWDLKILFYYEKYIFTIAFAFLISTICTGRRFSIFKVIPESKLFLLFGRINIAYFCVMEAVVYIFFTIYDIEFYFTYQNIFFMTLSLTVFTFLIGFFFVFLFELPIRKLIKIIRSPEQLL